MSVTNTVFGSVQHPAPHTYAEAKRLRNHVYPSGELLQPVSGDGGRQGLGVFVSPTEPPVVVFWQNGDLDLNPGLTPSARVRDVVRSCLPIGARLRVVTGVKRTGSRLDYEQELAGIRIPIGRCGRLRIAVGGRVYDPDAPPKER